MAYDLGQYEPLSADETEALLLEVKGQHSAFSDFSGTYQARTWRWKLFYVVR